MRLLRPFSTLAAFQRVLVPLFLLGVTAACSSSGDSSDDGVDQNTPLGSTTTNDDNPEPTESEGSNTEQPSPGASPTATVPNTPTTRPVPPVTSESPSASEAPSEETPNEPEPETDDEDSSTSANGDSNGDDSSEDNGGETNGEGGVGNDSSGGGGTTSDGGSGGETVEEPTGCGPAWPEASGEESLSETFEVEDSFDGELRRFSGSGALGTSGQEEDQGALFRLADGAILENVIIANPAADGIHCDGSCTLRNVWWEDVGEDAATLDGNDDSQVMTVECSGARGAEDKVFQHNGPGTFIIRNVVVEDFNRLYRSCGNCESQFTRHVVVEDVTVRSGNSLVGINENYDDTAEFSAVTVYGLEDDTTICALYEGNNTGAEPISLGSGPDGDHCLYDDSDISWE